MKSATSARLGDLTEPDRPITYGVVKPGPEQDGGVLFVRGGDVLGGHLALDALRTITPSVSSRYKRTLLRGGELLVSLVGNPGEVAIAPESLAGANIARQVGLVALRPEVNTRFVMYYLMSPRGRADLFVKTGGAVQQVINLAALKRVLIPIPPRHYQDYVADVLSAYDALIENCHRRVRLLEDAARLLFKEWFVYLRFPGHEHVNTVAGVPAGWRRAPLSELALLQYGKALKAENRIQGAYPVYGSSGVVGFHDKPLVAAPGIVVGRKGNVGSVYWSDRAFWPIDTVYYIGSASATLFLYYALCNTTFTNTDVAVPGLNRDYAHSRPVLVPPERLRLLFEDSVGPTHKQLEVLRKQSEALMQARDLLLPSLMSGELAA